MADSVNWAPIDGASLLSSYSTGSTKNNTMDKDAFLNLLVTQLKYQDPLDPVDNKESIAQLAQFSSLEQMQNISTTMNKQTAFGMVGKTVIGNIYSSDTGITSLVAGVVDSVRIASGEVYLVVGDAEMPLSNVQAVTDDYLGALSLINSNIAANQSMSLIGKNVQALIINSDGDVTGFVEGTVERVKVVSGRTILVVDGKEVYSEEVILVTDDTDKSLLGKYIYAKDVDPNSSSYNEEYEGTINGVTFDDKGKPILKIGTDSVKLDSVGEIPNVTDALALIGKEIKTTTKDGKVESVIIKGGFPYVVIDGKEISMTIVQESMYDE